jgi:chromosome segregation ATPase
MDACISSINFPLPALPHIAYATLFQLALTQRGPQNFAWRWTVRILTALCVIFYSKGTVQTKIALAVTSFVLSCLLGSKKLEPNQSALQQKLDKTISEHQEELLQEQQGTAEAKNEIIRLTSEHARILTDFLNLKKQMEELQKELDAARNELDRQSRLNIKFSEQITSFKNHGESCGVNPPEEASSSCQHEEELIRLKDILKFLKDNQTIDLVDGYKRMHESREEIASQLRLERRNFEEKAQIINSLYAEKESLKEKIQSLTSEKNQVVERNDELRNINASLRLQILILNEKLGENSAASEPKV